MSADHMKHFIHSIGHASQHERAKGNKGKANGLLLIGTGMLFLPVPFIGLPLIIWGICLCCSSGDGQ